ncbi:MAG TPA: CPBP family intramembrane glutamic endopeptidase [Terriglobales bacterium]|nr:CPBP family intramembrane glutamic endopeptidase [Terriglobales bacterium]
MATIALDQPRRDAGRLRVIAEIAIPYGLLEIALWSRRPAQLWWGIAMLVVVALLTLASRRSLRDLGLSRHGIECAIIVFPVTLAACALLLLTGWVFGWAHTIPISSRLFGAGYIVWAFVQQFMAQSFYYLRFEELFGSKRAVWVSALLFSLAHVPNPVLMPATFIGGLGFSEAFRRWRNLYPIWLAHAALGICVSATFPVLWTHQMRVGLGYFLLHIGVLSH